MKKTAALITPFVLGLGGLLLNTQQSEANELFKNVSVFRMYNPNSGEHLYTPSSYEKATLNNLGWKSEGVAWEIPDDIDLLNPFVTRLYNPNAGDHHYTADIGETTYLMSVGWKNDQIGFTTAGNDGVPVYRLYNPSAVTGAHHLTLSEAERDSLIQAGWQNEGTAFNAYKLNAASR